MRIIIMSEIANQLVIREENHIPPQGEYVDMFYEPKPKVVKVIHFPSDQTLKLIDPDNKIGLLRDTRSVDALVMVE